MSNISFPTKIISIQGKRFQITVPKKLVDLGLVNPGSEYMITLERIPNENNEVKK